MLLLTATTDYLELTTTAALSTDIVTSFVDITTTGFTPGSSEQNVSTATTVTIVAAPAASTQRQVKMLSIVNRSSSTAQTVSIDKNSSSTAYKVTGLITLQPGETLYYQDGVGFSVRDALGQIKQSNGAFANPSATIGLTATNGSATSGMRSDSAPALSQAITPTWTGLHAFNVGLYTAANSSGASSGDITAARTGATSNGALWFGAAGGGLYYDGTNLYFEAQDTGSFRPSNDNVTALGGASPFRWSVVYAATGTINTSDRTLKTDVRESPLGLDFIKALRPVAYRWKWGHGDGKVEGSRPGDRTHFGLIAQEVKAALPANQDFAGWTLADKNDPQSIQGLRYEQFIAPIIKAVQQIDARLTQLEQR